MAEPSDPATNGRSRPTKAPGAFRTISEVASELDVPQHVLRFWESRFSQVRPMKRGGGRRYYRPEDVALLRRIRNLLYDDGYTIKGVQKLLRQNGTRVEREAGEADTPSHDSAAAADSRGAGSDEALRREIRSIIGELESLRDSLSADAKDSS